MTTVTETADRQRRRREDLVKPLASIAVFLVILTIVLSWATLRLASSVKSAADDAGDAAAQALDNTRRIDKTQAGFCSGLRFAKDATNRTGAIIFVVLGTVAANSAKGPRPANATDYRKLSDLPRYQPSIDCRAALSDPSTYKAEDPIPFSRLSREALTKILQQPVG